jgi:hypothetical protein
MSSPFNIGRTVAVRGHISDITFARYDLEYCYFTLFCVDDVGVEAIIPCRIIGIEDVAIFRQQKIQPNAYIFVFGHTNFADHDYGRSYWVDVNWVHKNSVDKKFVKPTVDYRLAKNKPWYKALNTKIHDRVKGVWDKTNA